MGWSPVPLTSCYTSNLVASTTTKGTSFRLRNEFSATWTRADPKNQLDNLWDWYKFPNGLNDRLVILRTVQELAGRSFLLHSCVYVKDQRSVTIAEVRPFDVRWGESEQQERTIIGLKPWPSYLYIHQLCRQIGHIMHALLKLPPFILPPTSRSPGLWVTQPILTNAQLILSEASVSLFNDFCMTQKNNWFSGLSCQIGRRILFPFAPGKNLHRATHGDLYSLNILRGWEELSEKAGTINKINQLQVSRDCGRGSDRKQGSLCPRRHSKLQTLPPCPTILMASSPTSRQVSSSSVK